jgi:hypothetical protein
MTPNLAAFISRQLAGQLGALINPGFENPKIFAAGAADENIATPTESALHRTRIQSLS